MAAGGPPAPTLTECFQDQVDKVDPLVLQPLVGFHRDVHVPIAVLVAHVDGDPCRERPGECQGQGAQNPVLPGSQCESSLGLSVPTCGAGKGLARKLKK